MAKTKVIKSGSFPMTKGGSGHMVGKQSAVAQTPGVTATQGKKIGIAKGGKGHMFGKGHAVKQPSGQSGHNGNK